MRPAPGEEGNAKQARRLDFNQNQSTAGRRTEEGNHREYPSNGPGDAFPSTGAGGCGPVLLCAACGKRIGDAREGVVLWDGSRQDAAPTFAHAGRFAEIRPQSKPPARPPARPRRHSYAAAATEPGTLPPASCRAITRRTVLCVVPLITAAPRKVPASRQAAMMSIRSLADFNRSSRAVR